MTDPILAEMHKIKDANGGHYASMEALARSLAERESASRAEGRRFISKPARPGVKGSKPKASLKR